MFISDRKGKKGFSIILILKLFQTYQVVGPPLVLIVSFKLDEFSLRYRKKSVR